MEKNFVAKISKLDAAGGETLDQWRRRFLVCRSKAPLEVIDRLDHIAEEADESCGPLADSWDEIDSEWQTGLEAVLMEELIALGVVDAFQGVAVFELVAFGKRGPMSAGPRRFYVLKAGVAPVLYSTDNISSAFSAAERIAGSLDDCNLETLTKISAPSRRPERRFT